MRRRRWRCVCSLAAAPQPRVPRLAALPRRFAFEVRVALEPGDVFRDERVRLLPGQAFAAATFRRKVVRSADGWNCTYSSTSVTVSPCTTSVTS